MASNYPTVTRNVAMDATDRANVICISTSAVLRVNPLFVFCRLRKKVQASNTKVDLVICCGDFQSLRNEEDYDGLACPNKYKRLVRATAMHVKCSPR